MEAKTGMKNDVRIVHSGGQANDIARVFSGGGEYPDVYVLAEGSRKRIAAHCLHDQPYGFTREDVYMLRGREQDATQQQLCDLAARIEALLLPRS